MAPSWKQQLYAVKQEELPSRNAAAHAEVLHVTNSSKTIYSQPAPPPPRPSQHAAPSQTAATQKAQGSKKDNNTGRRNPPAQPPDSKRVFKDKKAALDLFQSPSFDVATFVTTTYQGLSEKGIASARQELVQLRDQARQQVQRAVHEHHTTFLTALRSVPLLDEAVGQLRGQVQTLHSLLDSLKLGAQAAGSSSSSSSRPPGQPDSPGQGAWPPSPLPAPPHTSQGPARRGLAPGGAAAALQQQMQEVVAELAQSCAERDYEAAISLLALGRDVRVLLDRDREQLEAEVHDLPMWALQFEQQLGVHQKQLVEELSSFLAAAGLQAPSPSERRGAAVALSALVGAPAAAAALLRCHSNAIRASQDQALRTHMQAGAFNASQSSLAAVAISQHTCLALAAAADDMSACWPLQPPSPAHGPPHTQPASLPPPAGRATHSVTSRLESDPEGGRDGGGGEGGRGAPERGREGEVQGAGGPQLWALLLQWAVREVQLCGQLLARALLLPLVNTAELQEQVLCVQACLLPCQSLELSHSLSLVGPFRRHLCRHIPGVLSHSLQALATATGTAIHQQVSQAAVLALQLQGAVQGPSQGQGPPAWLQLPDPNLPALLARLQAAGLPACNHLVTQLAWTHQAVAAVNSPGLFQVLVRGAVTAWGHLVAAAVAALQQVMQQLAPGPNSWHLRRLAQSLFSSLGAVAEGQLLQVCITTSTPAANRRTLCNQFNAELEQLSNLLDKLAAPPAPAPAPSPGPSPALAPSPTLAPAPAPPTYPAASIPGVLLDIVSVGGDSRPGMHSSKLAQPIEQRVQQSRRRQLNGQQPEAQQPEGQQQGWQGGWQPQERQQEQQQGQYSSHYEEQSTGRYTRQVSSSRRAHTQQPPPYQPAQQLPAQVEEEWAPPPLSSPAAAPVSAPHPPLRLALQQGQQAAGQAGDSRREAGQEAAQGRAGGKARQTEVLSPPLLPPQAAQQRPVHSPPLGGWEQQEQGREEQAEQGRLGDPHRLAPGAQSGAALHDQSHVKDRGVGNLRRRMPRPAPDSDDDKEASSASSLQPPARNDPVQPGLAHEPLVQPSSLRRPPSRPLMQANGGADRIAGEDAVKHDSSLKPTVRRIPRPEPGSSGDELPYQTKQPGQSRPVSLQTNGDVSSRVSKPTGSCRNDQQAVLAETKSAAAVEKRVALARLKAAAMDNDDDVL